MPESTPAPTPAEGQFTERELQVLNTIFIDTMHVGRCSEKPEHAIIMLPGRGNSAEHFMAVGYDMMLPNVVVVGMQPYKDRWYPQPYNPNDQAAALAGLPIARKTILDALARVKAGWGVPYDKMILCGFSAGGVMALELATKSNKTFCAAICFGGAILDPTAVPKANAKTSKTKILLQHTKDDECFDYVERFEPMRDALNAKGYKPSLMVSNGGGHTVRKQDVIQIAQWLGVQIVGDGFTHPDYYKLMATLRGQDDE